MCEMPLNQNKVAGGATREGWIWKQGGKGGRRKMKRER